MIEFEQILGSISVDQFVAETLGRHPLHLQGERGRFRSLLDWDGLARLLETHPVEPPRLAVMRNGQAISPERYLRRPGGISRLDGGALSLLLDAGATMIINHVDDMLPAVARLADDTGDRLGARTAVNLYANWRSEQGFGPHWDYHDVIVLQLAGSKEWPIYRPTRLDPVRGDPFEAPPAGAEPEQVARLDDGDFLYLPRGWIHSPAVVDGPSLHLTIAVTRPTGKSFLEWLGEEATDDLAVRATIPLSGDHHAHSAWKADFEKIVGRPIDDASIENFLAQKDSDRGARPRFSFPDFGRFAPEEWTRDTQFRAASPHRIVVEQGPAGFHVDVLGTAVPCSPGMAKILGRLTSTNPLTLAQMMDEGLGRVDVKQLRQMLAMLVKLGQVSATRA